MCASLQCPAPSSKREQIRQNCASARLRVSAQPGCRPVFRIGGSQLGRILRPDEEEVAGGRALDHSGRPKATFPAWPALGCETFPRVHQNLPRTTGTGNLAQQRPYSAGHRAAQSFNPAILPTFPSIFPVIWEYRPRDWFGPDCVAHHLFQWLRCRGEPPLGGRIAPGQHSAT